MVDLTRPIIGIENRTAQEVFDIMCDRFRMSEAEAEALSRTGAVKVKALEWEERKTRLGTVWWSAPNPLGGLSIEAASENDKIAAQADFEHRILSALEPAATCNESLQVEPAAPEGQQPVADALELSGNTGELIDRMAAAIRDWGSHYDDGPWETLPEDRKAGWRGDAERALAVVKEYLTARCPSEQAVTEAEHE